MDDTSNKEEPKKRKGRGCLITCFVAVGFMVYAFWQIGAPGRRAGDVHKSIQYGMKFQQVEDLLKSRNDRHYVSYNITTNGDWNTASRDQFVSSFNAKTNNPNLHGRIQLTFMGTAPGRVSFSVEFDSTGRVSKVTAPRGWD